MDIKVVCPHCNKEIKVCTPKHKDCIYLNGEKKSVGIKCTNPNKRWARKLSMYKQPSGPACSMFTPKDKIHIVEIGE